MAINKNDSPAVIALRVCDSALRSIETFKFSAGDNPLQLKVDAHNTSTSTILRNRIISILEAETISQNPFRAFVESVAAMQAPDLEKISNDDAFTKTGELAELISDAYDLIKHAPPVKKPWHGWIASYGNHGLKVEFFDDPEKFKKEISDYEKFYGPDNEEAGTFTYGEGH